MSVEPEVCVEVVQHYAAPAERVFDAFLDVSVARRFLFATADGEMVVAEIEPVVGGRYTFTERRPEMGEVRHVGEYVEIERPSRLVFTFGVPQFDPGETTVAVEISETDTGCSLRLTNAGVPAEWADGNRDGWRKILAGLLPALDGVHGAGWL